MCDTRPLSRLGELDALMRGRATYSLKRGGGRLELWHRDDFRIAGSPAGEGRADVLAEHVCGWVPQGVTRSYFRTDADPTSDVCPF